MNNETTSALAASATTRSAPRLWRRAEVWAAGAAVLCFLNTLPNDYCYDDNRVVQHSPKVTAPEQWKAIWTTDYWYETQEENPQRDLLYRPITLSSYRLIRMVGGQGPFAQHLVNLILHAIVCVLVVRICRCVHASESAALVAGVLFAVLPIHTEAVAPVVGRADLLAALGVLIAVLAHQSAMAASSRSSSGGWWTAAGLAAFLAMGSKESGMAVVPLVVLCDALFHLTDKRLTRPRRWLAVSALGRLCYLLIPFVAYLALRIHALGGQLVQAPAVTKTVNVLVDAPTWQHAFGVLQLWGMYWTKTFWPDVLSVKYSVNAIHLATTLLDWHVLIGAAAAVLLIVASVQCWRKGTKCVALLSAALVISYLPTANAIVLIQVFFAERIWYLPSVWAVILIALAVGPYLKRPAWSILFVAVVVAMLGRCWVRNAEWRDNGTLYAAAYRDQPDGIGVLHLYGQWLVNHEQFDKGIRLLGRAVEIDLGFTDAHRTLGDAYLQSGDLGAALRHLQIADMQVSGHRPTVERLAWASRELAYADEQLADLRRRADDSPGDMETHVALIRRLRDLGLLHEAWTLHQQGQEIFASDALWQAEYAVTFVYLNRIDEAINHYRTSLDLEPQSPQRAVELAMLLIERRGSADLNEAQRWADHAFDLAPGDPAVLACLAELAALRGDLSRAIALYEQAIRKLPIESPQRRAFQQRLAVLGG